MRKIFTGIVVLFLTTAPSLACLNDSDLVKSENEFKSTYLHPSDQGRSSDFPFGIVAITIGLAGMAGASFILSRAPRR